MTKHQLMKYRDIVREVAQLEEQRLKIDDTLRRCTGRISDMPRGGVDDDKMASLIASKVDLNNLINSRVTDQFQAQAEIERAIEGLPPRERTLMRARYINGLDWISVCVELRLEWAQTHRCHSEALKRIG